MTHIKITIEITGDKLTIDTGQDTTNEPGVQKPAPDEEIHE